MALPPEVTEALAQAKRVMEQKLRAFVDFLIAKRLNPGLPAVEEVDLVDD